MRRFGASSATALVLACLLADVAFAQTISQRGFVEAGGFFFAERAPNDPTLAVGDLLVREELFARPVGWLRLAAGLDLRGGTHDQVEDRWRLDLSDRSVRRPRLSVRRLALTLSRGPLTLDVGKQFIRWGKADIVNPTDRFAPRDFLSVVDNEFLAVAGARVADLLPIFPEPIGRAFSGSIAPPASGTSWRCVVVCRPRWSCSRTAPVFIASRPNNALISVDLPEPDTPVTQVNRPTGKSTLTDFRLWPVAPTTRSVCSSLTGFMAASVEVAIAGDGWESSA